MALKILLLSLLSVTALLADPARTDADRAADALRRPAETLTLAGVDAGWAVAELERVRQARAEARAEAKRRQEEAEAARRAAIEADEGLMLELKRQERKDRKSQQKDQAKAKKERLSAYKNMKISA